MEASWAWFPGSAALGRAPVAMRPLKKIAASHVDSYFRFEMRFFVIFEGFGTDFRRFWEARMEAKSDFWEVCFDVFFGRDFGIVFK